MDEQHPHIPVQRSLLTPSRLLAVAFIAVSAVSAAWIVREEPALGRAALLSGTPLPASELALMEAAFDRANLTDYSIEGGRILVPKHRQSGYMRALVDAGALPKEFGGSLRRALESNSPWQSKSLQQELLRVATQEELSLVICSMPGIRRASVLYDSEERPGVVGGREKTASVNIETEGEASMSPERIRAIRVLVARAIAGLAADRVAVTDLRSGRVFAGPLDDESPLAAVDPAVRAQASFEEHLAAKVRQAIGFVKGAIVDVSVTFAEAAPPRQMRGAVEPPAVDARANAPAEVAPPPRPIDVPAAAGPPGKRVLDTVRVSVAVPDTYFRSLLERMSSPLDPRAQVELEDREIERIRDHVSSVLPPVAGAKDGMVAVTKFPVVASATFRQDGPSAAEGGARLRDEADAGRAARSLSEDEEVVSVRLPASIARLVSRKDGGPLSLTRESLLGGTSLLFAVLACMFWIFGRPSSRATLLLLVAAIAVGPSAIAADDVAAATQAANAAASVDPPSAPRSSEAGAVAGLLEQFFAGRSLGVSLSAAAVFGVVSLAPAVLLMTTAFVRLSVVLALVRQGIGTPQLPSNQVVTSLAIFLTALVMWPVWTAVWRDGVEPFTEGRGGLAEAFDSGSRPLKRWMTGQIEAAGNADTLGFFVARTAAAGGRETATAGPQASVASAASAPIQAVLPAFLVSELEVAFAIGLRLLVPFLVLDVVVGSIVTAMGLVTLSPATVSLPLKLLVFVLADGWTLIVKSLLDGFVAVV